MIMCKCRNLMIFVFCIIKLLFILNIVYSDSCEKKINQCLIVCEGNYDDWKSKLHELLQTINCTNKRTLQIQRGTYPSKILPDNWLLDKARIEAILFENCNFEVIEPNALSISTLNELTFTDCEITNLYKHYFTSASGLESFTFNCAAGRNLHVEAKLFEDNLSLAILKIENCLLDPYVINNITGKYGSVTNQLQSIHLSNNKITRLPEFTFQNAKNLRGLYLSKTGIEYIDRKAFWGPNIQLLRLDGNLLTTLQDGTFKDHSVGQYAKIHLQGNRWKCDCHLKWLQELYLETNSIISKTPPPYCDGDYDKLFENQTFDCDLRTTTPTITPSTITPSTITTSMITTTIATTFTTTNSNDVDHWNNNLTLNCLQGTKETLHRVIEDNDREYLMRLVIEQSQNRLIKMTIFNLDENPQILIEFDGNLKKINLLYFEIFNSTDIICIKNIQKSLTLSDLKRNHTYTMCLIEDEAFNVPPSSCFGLKVPPEWSERSWIRNKQKVLFISLAAVSSFLCISISSTITYFTIRFFPQLIKGNKNVIIVKQSKESKLQAYNDSINFERPEYTEPSAFTQPSGYLTPSYPHYERINYYKRAVDLTYGSTKNGYISPETNSKLNTFMPTAPSLPRINTKTNPIY